MDLIFKAIAGVMIALVLCQILQLREKHFSVLLVIAVCCMVTTIAADYLKQILGFLWHLEDLGGLNGDILQILLKTVGISLLAELAATICQDAGNGSLGKMIQLLSSLGILWMCLPVFHELIGLAQTILEAA